MPLNLTERGPAQQSAVVELACSPAAQYGADLLDRPSSFKKSHLKSFKELESSTFEKPFSLRT
ncbi:hypothetical protein EYF80_001478 [Liparis tanakae]|uniref:Uncharacterized protein n=1 Tax=Liparis tanakae TaxID=230148 RepID=A0A4Z2JG57_9TELE|nr:hypothetical protein EYF80_001478 [Liparis tanakae]